MSKDELKALIHRAAKRNAVSRYAIGIRLGYKNRSAIYAIEAGRKGLSADKLFALMRMAGKLALLATSTLLIGTSNAPEAQAQVHPAFNTSMHYTHISYAQRARPQPAD